MSKSEKKKTRITIRRSNALFDRICIILEEARNRVIRTVNREMVQAYWQVGREILEEEQNGEERAEYGKYLIERLAEQLKARFGKGFNISALRRMRQFYTAYPKGAATRHLLDISERNRKRATLWRESQSKWELPWSHYRLLISIGNPLKRYYYESEAIHNNWSFRELERQVHSLLYERLAKCRDKKGLMRLAKKGQEIQRPEDAIKDPFVLEFLDLPESHKLVESKLETALIDDLKKFLLELGKGFAFIERQRRLTLDGDHFYVDLVFYHTILKCYVLIDLKTTKLSHADLGQMQLYVNYFDEECRAEGDNPTVGLILCTDKNETVVKYTLAKGNKRIFASRYKLYLPTEDELKKEIQMERRALTATKK